MYIASGNFSTTPPSTEIIEVNGWEEVASGSNGTVYSYSSGGVMKTAGPLRLKVCLKLKRAGVHSKRLMTAIW